MRWVFGLILVLAALWAWETWNERAQLVLYIPATDAGVKRVPERIYQGFAAWDRCNAAALAALNATGQDEIITARCEPVQR